MLPSTPIIDRLNDRAYARWNGGDLDSIQTKRGFWLALDAAERDAVVVTALVAQVRNGGFGQWHDNGYSASYDLLESLLDRMPKTEITDAVRMLVGRAAEAIMVHGADTDEWGYDEALESVLDDLSDDLYGVDEGFLVAAEAYIGMEDSREA